MNCKLLSIILLSICLAQTMQALSVAPGLPAAQGSRLLAADGKNPETLVLRGVRSTFVRPINRLPVQPKRRDRKLAADATNSNSRVLRGFRPVLTRPIRPFRRGRLLAGATPAVINGRMLRAGGGGGDKRCTLARPCRRKLWGLKSLFDRLRGRKL